MFFLIALAQETASPLPDADLSFGWLFVKTIVAMVVVIVLAFIFLRYLLPRLQGGRRGRTSHIKIHDRVGLEPRKALFVVQVGSKYSLVGVSDHGIAKIQDLDAKDLESSGGA